MSKDPKKTQEIVAKLTPGGHDCWCKSVTLVIIPVLILPALVEFQGVDEAWARGVLRACGNVAKSDIEEKACGLCETFVGIGRDKATCTSQEIGAMSRRGVAVRDR